MTILVVEDEPRLASVLVKGLTEEGLGQHPEVREDVRAEARDERLRGAAPTQLDRIELEARLQIARRFSASPARGARAEDQQEREREGLLHLRGLAERPEERPPPSMKTR